MSTDKRKPKPRGRPPKYDWDRLLDGQKHTLRRVHPDDTAPLGANEIDATIMAFRTGASQQATKRGLSATIFDNGGQYLVVQAYDPNDRRRPKLTMEDIDLGNMPKSTPPAENFCTVCGALCSPLVVGHSRMAIGETQCWVMDGWTPIGPEHE